MAGVQDLESLLRQGVELSRAKRFREAEPIFRQVLILEPRHTGAAYLLSLCLYFMGQFRQALQLFGQLISPHSPLEPAQVDRLVELSSYAHYETLRLDYWEGLSQKNLDRAGVDAKILNRSGRVVLLPGFSDVDDTIGANLEAISDDRYDLIPFRSLSAVEFGPMKRWITAQMVFRDGRRETMLTPLTYSNSMNQTAYGIQEGVETMVRPLEGTPELSRAFGQKQFRSVSARVPLSEILRIEL
jgi:tetratricopeptide (TPR) repeat protein